MAFSYILVVVLLGILFPALSIWQGPATKKSLQQNPKKLTGIYQQTLGIQIVFTLLVILALFQNNDTIDDIGLSFIRNIPYTLLLFVIGFICLWLLKSWSISASKIESLKKDYAEINYVIPGNKKEFQWSVLLAFGVGFMEEILYRGFLFWQLNMHMPLIVAILLTNIIFGLLHYGTGKKNAISTFWLGMVFSALSVPFDTLWFAILAHILTDIYAVVIGYKIKNE